MIHQLSVLGGIVTRGPAGPQRHRTIKRLGATVPVIALASVFTAALLGGCSAESSFAAKKRNNLDTMQKTTIKIGNQPFETWLALTPQQRELGLMQVTAEELAPIPNPAGTGQPDIERGMLFVFGNEQQLSFWMYNTITPLDIAYIAADGRIVKIYTMAPLETRLYPSIAPAQFALEVRAGLFSELGIAAGQYVEIPQSILKKAS